MAPRQRLSPQPSMDELSAGVMTGSSTELQQQPPLVKTVVGDESSSASTRTDTTKKENPASGAQRVLVSEEARAHHDYFNLIALMIVIASAGIDWDYELLFQGMGSLAFKNEHFLLTWGVVIAYFVIDLIWVTQIPHCVKSPKTIVQHHLVVIFYMFAPLIWSEYRWFVGALLSVEINTWFMILRRVVYKRKLRMLSDAVAFSFYASWIVIRCYIYPAVLFHFFHLVDITVRATGRLWHWPMVFIPVHFVLCCLNLKWSFDLFYPIVKSWLRPDADKPSVANGL